MTISPSESPWSKNTCALCLPGEEPLPTSDGWGLLGVIVATVSKAQILESGKTRRTPSICLPNYEALVFGHSGQRNTKDQSYVIKSDREEKEKRIRRGRPDANLSIGHANRNLERLKCGCALLRHGSQDRPNKSCRKGGCN